MNSGKTILSQLMDFIPPYEFRKCVDRYNGNYKVKSFSCWDHFLCMAFAQFTYRESLRATKFKLYHLAVRGKGLPQYPGARQSTQRLAYLCQFCQNSHRTSQKTLRCRFFRHRTETNRLRPGFDHHRSLSVFISLGQVPEAECYRKNAHPSGPAWQHSLCGDLNPRKRPRCQYPRRFDHRGRDHLYYGSRFIST